MVAANAEQGRAVVDSLAEAGAAFIKVYSKLSPETYFAIGARAKEVGIPFAGHVPFRVMAAEASDAGQRTMEHLLGILAGCSTEEMQIMEESSNAWQTLAAGDSAAFLQMLYQIGQRKLETQSEPKANMLFAKLVENETWQVPTLVAWRGYRFTNDPAFRNDPRMKYLHKIMRAFWNPSINPLMKIRSEADWELGRRSYKQKLEVVGMMDKAGVPLLAGSDTPNPYAFPGFGLHDELELLVEAGLSPLAALQAATLNPARFFGATDSLGAVEIGKMADLVVLDENPLEDIRNTQKIYAVVANGQLLERPQLDALLAEVEAENSKKSIAELMMKLIQADGVDTANEKYRQMKKESSKEYDFSEWELNMLGYQLLGTKKIKEAIKIFQLNVEAYPNSANVYDSLGEAYMLNGDRELAIENYKKSLELNPKNQNAVTKLRELETNTMKK
ncbi:MAG: amidohydrolase family protein [Desulfobacterales bacterium]